MEKIRKKLKSEECWVKVCIMDLNDKKKVKNKHLLLQIWNLNDKSFVEIKVGMSSDLILSLFKKYINLFLLKLINYVLLLLITLHYNTEILKDLM